MPNPFKSRKFSDFVEEVNSIKEKQNIHISAKENSFYEVSVTLVMMAFKNF